MRYQKEKIWFVDNNPVNFLDMRNAYIKEDAYAIECAVNIWKVAVDQAWVEDRSINVIDFNKVCKFKKNFDINYFWAASHHGGSSINNILEN